MVTPDLFVARFNTADDLIWVKQAGGDHYDRGYGIAVDADRNVYTAGFFTGTCGFESQTFNSKGGFDGFTARLDGPPRLKVAREGNQCVVFWPTNQAGFRLESVTNLSALNAWTVVSNPPVAAGEQYFVTNPVTASRRFFRLRQP